eukprot:COSAG02_NODE_1835_length_10714_cov_7.585437_10_plen_80_part_00
MANQLMVAVRMVTALSLIQEMVVSRWDQSECVNHPSFVHGVLSVGMVPSPSSLLVVFSCPTLRMASKTGSYSTNLAQTR